MAFLSAQRVTRARRTSGLATLFSALGVWRQRRRLTQLDPHLRRDIGLTDEQVSREAERPIWDVPQTWRL